MATILLNFGKWPIMKYANKKEIGAREQHKLTKSADFFMMISAYILKTSTPGTPATTQDVPFLSSV